MLRHATLSIDLLWCFGLQTSHHHCGEGSVLQKLQIENYDKIYIHASDLSQRVDWLDKLNLNIWGLSKILFG